MEMTGSRILIECLHREGVEFLFGYPGGAILDIYDALSSAPFHNVLVRHEQAAVHAADGYARATGKVGVCLVTSGPGATNAVTGIATAYCDSIPLVVFSGQVPTSLIGNDAFQEVDIVGITRPCTKHNYLVRDVKRLAQTIREAFHLARSGRPGPVLVDLPKDVMNAVTPFVWPEQVSIRSYNPSYRPNLNQLRKAAVALTEAKKPLLLVGGGVCLSGADEEVTWLAHELNIPVTGTLMGLGGFPGDDELWLGMVGMHGTYTANKAINSCDLLVSVGARFDDRVTGRLSTFAPNAKIVHIDIDPTSIRKNVHVDIPVVADCRLALEGLRDVLGASLAETDWKAKHSAWVEQLGQWKSAQPLCCKQDPNGPIKPQHVIRTIYEMTRGEAIISTEVGQNQMWAAQFYAYKKPRTLLTSGGLGTMGFGFPAAIGAQLAFPDKLVIDIAGDGSIQMNIQELATAVQEKLPVKIIILNNQYLGMVRQWQELFYKRNYSGTPMEMQPDFVALAKAYGAEGYRVTKLEELVPMLEKTFAHPGLVVLDIQVDREENVYPMVPAGAALDDMLLV